MAMLALGRAAQRVLVVAAAGGEAVGEVAAGQVLARRGRALAVGVDAARDSVARLSARALGDAVGDLADPSGCSGSSDALLSERLRRDPRARCGRRGRSAPMASDGPQLPAG